MFHGGGLRERERERQRQRQTHRERERVESESTQNWLWDSQIAKKQTFKKKNFTIKGNKI